MSKSCMDCIKREECATFDTVDANKCEKYRSSWSDLIDQVRAKSTEEWESRYPNPTNLENLINYLIDKSTISTDGKLDTEVVVHKEVLRLAAVYLQDYYYDVLK